MNHHKEDHLQLTHLRAELDDNNHKKRKGKHSVTCFVVTVTKDGLKQRVTTL